jgi:6-phosphogluconolactonase
MQRDKFKSVFLTGGKTSKKVYSAIAQNENFYQLSDINFFMGDERLVPRSSAESNCRLISETLFINGIPSNCNFFAMPSDIFALEHSISEYEKYIPNEIELILLSWGEDGHLASIFPGEPALNELNKLVTQVSPKYYPYERLTITPNVLMRCKSAYIFSEGEIKARSIEEYKKSDHDKKFYPAYYLKNISWFIDQDPKIIADKIMATLVNL